MFAVALMYLFVSIIYTVIDTLDDDMLVEKLMKEYGNRWFAYLIVASPFVFSKRLYSNIIKPKLQVFKEKLLKVAKKYQ